MVREYWNYLHNDYYAYRTVWQSSAYTCQYASTWRITGDGGGCYGNSPVSFYNDLYNYGYNYGFIGRGGQCKYFADLILYRSESQQPRLSPGDHTLPSYAEMSLKTASVTTAKQGDIIFSTTIPHTAIVVELKSNGLDVIDSNYVGGIGNEYIGRHLMTYTELNAGNYKVYTGVSYYNENYVP